MRRLIIKHRWALGDTVLLTALIRDIQLAYPNQYEIKVVTNFKNVWANNPYISDFEDNSLPRATKVDVNWGEAIKTNAYATFPHGKEMRHILAWYHYDFEKKTGIPVPVTAPKPDLHFGSDEIAPRVSGRYWVIVAGGKLDATVKHWHHHRAQEVVDKLAANGITCVQVGAVNTDHIHTPLERCTNLVGKTENARDLWNVIKYSEGVICGITGAMHIAAAFDKPCVVYAGGREEPWFEAYVNSFKAFGPTALPVAVEHKYLHTIGLLECCNVQGCWKNRVIPLDPADLTRKVHTLCRNPLRFDDSHPVAKCQDLIQSDHVVKAVMEYYDDKTLPPIQPLNQNLDLKPEELMIPKVELIRINPENVTRVELIREPSVDIREQRPVQQVYPYELKQTPVTTTRELPLMDHPVIGGKLTVCMLCYGPHTDIAKRALNSLLESVPANRLDIRVATNQAAPSTISYLKTLPLTKIYINSENRYKYPVMREMFFDVRTPLNTNYLLWLDDDTWVADPNWINDLCQNIIDNHHRNYRMYGNVMYHDLRLYMKDGHRPDTWFRQADWYRGRHLKSRSGGTEAPNGSVIDFAVGWCWAIQTELIREANIPDIRLQHNGGDITIGEQVHQAGYLIKQWNKNKSLISCPPKDEGGRRGFSQRFPWDPQSNL